MARAKGRHEDAAGDKDAGTMVGLPNATQAQPVAPQQQPASPEAMIRIPGGSFRMGSDSHYPEEAPAHPVAGDGFWIDRTPVTNREFRRFVNATGYDWSQWWAFTFGANWRHPHGRRSTVVGLDSHPVVQYRLSRHPDVRRVDRQGIADRSGMGPISQTVSARPVTRNINRFILALATSGVPF